MVNKNKQKPIKNISERVSIISAQVGLAALLMAAVATTAEATIHEGHKLAAILSHPIYSSSSAHADQTVGHELRRSGGPKEEIGHSSASYGSMRRSASVAGTL